MVAILRVFAKNLSRLLAEGLTRTLRASIGLNTSYLRILAVLIVSPLIFSSVVAAETYAAGQYYLVQPVSRLCYACRFDRLNPGPPDIVLLSTARYIPGETHLTVVSMIQRKRTLKKQIATLKLRLIKLKKQKFSSAASKSSLAKNLKQKVDKLTKLNAVISGCEAFALKHSTPEVPVASCVTADGLCRDRCGAGETAQIAGLCNGSKVCCAADPSADGTPPADPELIIPIPQSVSPFDENAPAVLNKNWQIVASLDDENSFAADYLADAVSQQTSGALKLSRRELSNFQGYEATSPMIFIGDPEQSPLLKQIAGWYDVEPARDIGGIADQGYILLIRSNLILILSSSPTGRLYGAVSLRWLIEQGQDDIVLPAVLITDWPDLEVRGFQGNGTYIAPSLGIPLTTTVDPQLWIDELLRYKYNLWTDAPLRLNAPLDQNGYLIPLSGESPPVVAARELAGYLRKRQFRVSLNLSPLDVQRELGIPDYQEGVWVHDHVFQWNSLGVAIPSQSPLDLLNPGFENDQNSDGTPDNWSWSGGEAPGSWSLSTLERMSGKNSVTLTLTQDLSSNQGGSVVLKSRVYSASPGDAYHLSFWAKKQVDAAYGEQNPEVDVVLLDGNGAEVYSAEPVLINAADNRWRQYRISFAAGSEVRGFYVASKASGTKPLTYWLDDFAVVNLADQLLNVLSTSSTQLEVRSLDGSVLYSEGVDYDLVQQGAINLENPLAGTRTSVRRRTNGAIPAREPVLISYDFAVKLNYQGDEYFSLSEPDFLDLYDQYTLQPSLSFIEPDYVYVGMDGIRGMNRDSRSRALGLSNRDLLTQFMNTLSERVAGSAPQSALIVSDQMMSPFDAGGDELRQMRVGGETGATWSNVDILPLNVVLFSSWSGQKDSKKKIAQSGPLFSRINFPFLGGPGLRDARVIRWWSHQTYANYGQGLVGEAIDGITDELVTLADYSWNAVREYDSAGDPDYIEICNETDDDLDDLFWADPLASTPNKGNGSGIDEGFDLSSDRFNCGSCQNVCYSETAGFGSCSDGVCVDPSS